MLRLLKWRTKWEKAWNQPCCYQVDEADSVGEEELEGHWTEEKSYFGPENHGSECQERDCNINFPTRQWRRIESSIDKEGYS